MTEGKSHDFVHTNIHVFYKIAQESYEAISQDLNSRRKPKPGDEPGWIIAYDPYQKSFKNAFVTIIFSVVYLESLFHLLMVKQFGKEISEYRDREKLEKKLINLVVIKRLGVEKAYTEKKKMTDVIFETLLNKLGDDEKSLIGSCKTLRETRNGIIHEKAHFDSGKIHVAQKEAENAFEVVKAVTGYFNIELG